MERRAIVVEFHMLYKIYRLFLRRNLIFGHFSILIVFFLLLERKFYEILLLIVK